ncbi:MAG TPA: rubrerythrin family protein [Fibrobacteria bacterium]|nr:rubrerythrin family protein [Fibrobacteria bacterium]
MNDSQSATLKNLESAFAGESMAHMKYLHFAKIARANGHVEVARVFEETAAQEIKHALAHAELIYPARLVGTEKALELAIEGETYEYTEMYPGFQRDAEKEGNLAAKRELEEQIAESKEHAELFRNTLALAAKRFAALARIEEKHANQYRQTLSKVKA